MLISHNAHQHSDLKMSWTKLKLTTFVEGNIFSFPLGFSIYMSLKHYQSQRINLEGVTSDHLLRKGGIGSHHFSKIHLRHRCLYLSCVLHRFVRFQPIHLD